MFQVFAAIHSAVEQHSSRDFGVEVPHHLSNTKSVRLLMKFIYNRSFKIHVFPLI